MKIHLLVLALSCVCLGQPMVAAAAPKLEALGTASPTVVPQVITEGLVARESAAIRSGLAPMSFFGDSRESGCGFLGQVWCSGSCTEVRKSLGNMLSLSRKTRNTCLLITAACNRNFGICSCDIIHPTGQTAIACDPSKPWDEPTKTSSEVVTPW